LLVFLVDVKPKVKNCHDNRLFNLLGLTEVLHQEVGTVSSFLAFDAEISGEKRIDEVLVHLGYLRDD
jgi:hypothetical protein